MNKKIANVVFYKFWDPTREDAMQQACIFYEDGTVKNTTHEEGLEAAYEIANADRLSGKQFRTMLNRNRVYTMSGEEFERRYQEFIKVSPENIAAAVNAEMVNVEATRHNKPTRTTTNTQLQPSRPVNNQPVRNTQSIIENYQRSMNQILADGEERLRRLRATTQNQPGINRQIEDIERQMQATKETMAAEVQKILEEERQNNAKKVQTKPVQPQYQSQTGTGSKQSSQNQQHTTNNGPVIPVVPVVAPTSGQNTTSASEQVSTGQTNGDSQTTTPEQTNTSSEKNKKSSLWQRFKKSKVGKRVTALLVATSLLLGGIGGYHLGKNSKSGIMKDNNISSQQFDEDAIEAQDVAYNKLLNETKNEDLKAIMTKQGQNLDMYNRDFAALHLETGKDVKAALSWDEVIALNLAYNDYTPEQIRLMFNGSEVNSLGLSHAYKNAQLQLMGAYVISDRENPVNMAGFINDEEGKAFVEKYEDLFYKCKEVTGDERVTAVNTFYKELFKDFPISDEIREVGLSHADGRKMVKNYMAAVAPMVAASEIMWQNLKIDHTLSDKATAYFNDIGLCNIAEDAFERAERITEVAELNKDVPTYEQFMNAKIAELMIEGNYVTDDAHRDLSQLDEFQKWVNGHFKFDENGYNTGVIVRTETSTRTETTYRTETTTHKTSNRDEAVNMAGEDAVKKAEDKVNQQIDKENADNKAKGEAEAEDKRQDLQDEADKESEKLQDEVEKDDQDLQDKIDDANNNINNGGTVNEDDLGHGTDFDNDHSDENGNLNDNIGDITTDGDGAYDHNDPLPDPNETGQSFDQGRQTTSNQTPSEDYTDGSVYTYEEPYVAPTNAQIVDQMIRDMEAQENQAESAKVYTK